METKEIFDDDEAFDPKKLFDEKEYSTLIIKREGFSKKQNSAADLIEALLEKEISREESEIIFTKLKDADARGMLVKAIKSATDPQQKTILTAACWETGMDFSPFFLYFVELTTDDHFLLALEALSVVESCEANLDQQTLATALEMTENSKSKNPALIKDLLENIKSRIS